MLHVLVGQHTRVEARHRRGHRRQKLFQQVGVGELTLPAQGRRARASSGWPMALDASLECHCPRRQSRRRWLAVQRHYLWVVAAVQAVNDYP